jgi:hypothetical protein
MNAQSFFAVWVLAWFVILAVVGAVILAEVF